MKIIERGRSFFLATLLSLGLAKGLYAESSANCPSSINALFSTPRAEAWTIIMGINPGAFKRFAELKETPRVGWITVESYSLKFSRPFHLSRMEFSDALKAGIITYEGNGFYSFY